MNKVVAHCLDGQLLKGTTSDFMPTKDRFHLFVEGSTKGTPAVEIKLAQLKALFFVVDLEGSPSRQDAYDLELAAQGRKIRVEFNDGEIMLGTTNGYVPGRPGFFLFPADPASNNQRCFVVSAATKKITLL